MLYVLFMNMCCIPFEVSIDPFYSEGNQEYLKKVITDIDSGASKLVEHNLIEE